MLSAIEGDIAVGMRMNRLVSWAMVITLLINVFALSFFVRPVKAEPGTIYIRADGSVDPPTAPIVNVGNVYYTFTANVYDAIVVQRNNIVVDGAGYTVQGTSAGTGISLSLRRGVIIKNVKITLFSKGIELYYSFNNTLSSNTITNNSGHGIALDDARSSNNTIFGNNITNNRYYGIGILDISSDIYITSNVITNNWVGIFLGGSNHAISGNNITWNDIGIYLWESTNSIIFGNNITANNNFGMYLYKSSGNTVHHNNFINNGYSNEYAYPQAYASVGGYPNMWDDGFTSGGNYWSDYTGIDANGDGMGDTPYFIDANNRDRYPLINPWIITPTPENRPPKRPTNYLPENGAENTNLVITLWASGFSDPDYGDECNNIHWQITIAPGDYSHLVFDKVGYAEPINQMILPSGTLNYGTTYYWHMRYQDDHGAWPEWSEETSFTTAPLSFDYCPRNPFTGEEIAFTVSNRPPGAVYEWDFGDNTASHGMGVTHSYGAVGLYTVVLTLTDQNEKQSTASLELVVSEDELIPSLEISNLQPKVDEEIVLDASNSNNLNPRVEITSYKWEFFDNEGTKIKEGTTRSPVIFYYWKKEGEYSVRLIVENENGVTAATSATILVQGKNLWEDWFKDRPELDRQRLNEIISSLDLKVGYWESDFKSPEELAAILCKPVASKEILTNAIEDREDAAAYTYAAKIALTLGEMEMVNDVLTWQANIDLAQRVDTYLPYTATLEAVRSIAIIMAKGAVSGIKWIGVIIKGGIGVYELSDVGKGVAEIEEKIPTLGVWKTAEYYNALRQYLELRSEGCSHSEAWNSPEVVYSFTVYTQDERNALEASFMRLGDTYAQHVGSYGLQEDFIGQVKEGLKTELLYALEQYKFEPLYEQVKINSAGELRVYDSLNRVTGLVNGQIRQEIPLSFYDEENEIVVIFDPSDTYLYEVVGIDEGTYGLKITSVEYGNITTFAAADIPISLGATHQYNIDWAALSLGEEGVTVQVDSDGDGVFEHTFASDSELTQSEYVIATDSTPPETQLNIGEPKIVVNGVTHLTSATPIELTAEDDFDGSGVASTACRIHNATYSSDWIASAQTFYLVGLSDGTYQIDYNSTDIAGNVEPTTTAIVILDNTPPTSTISIGQPKCVADKIYVNRDTPFTLGADDGEGSGIYSIAYRISNTTYDSGWLLYTAPFRLTALSDGVYTISFNATDNVGNLEAAKSVQGTLFSWNCVFTDSYGRGTILKINTQYKLFQFIAPGKDFGVKQDPKMFAVYGVILIGYKDSEMQLAAAGAYGGLTFCAATAWDKQTGKQYLLIQKPIFRCHPRENLMP